MADQLADPAWTVPTREQVLADLDLLATVEHMLVVEYLWIHCALGHDAAPPDDSDVNVRVAAAAGAIFECAMSAMRRLRRINQALVFAGRPPQTGRATAIGVADGTDVVLTPPGHDRSARLIDREVKIAQAADARFEKLRPVVESSSAILTGDLRLFIEFIVEAGVDHTVALNEFRGNIAGLSPDEYLRATYREPDTEVERSLLDLSDRYYGVTIAALSAEFAHPEDFGGRLLQGAVSVMHLLSGVNGLLAARGLLPRFGGA